VGELLDAAANVAAYAAVIVLAGWGLQRVFGVQVFGIAGMLGVLVVIAGVRVFSNSGVAGLIATAICLLAVAIVIGMAMTLGAERPDRSDDERALDDS
jgi:4-hydroxybenzoate polyprenyltransferase